MRISIVPFEPRHAEAVRLFNDRLRKGGQPSQFPGESVSKWLPPVPGRRLFQERFVAVDAQETVRGAYILKHQDYLVNGRPFTIGDFQQPISEGTVDRAYAGLGVAMLLDCLKRNALNYGLGIGSPHEPIARLVRAAGWTFSTVPFLFKVFHPFTFLQNLAYLRQTLLRSLTLDLAAFSGLGWLAIRTLQRFRARPQDPEITAEPVGAFEAWAEELWERCRGSYKYIATRDRTSLDILYPPDQKRFLRLQIRRGQQVIGWAVCLNTPMTRHKQFGSMRLGSLVDALALPSDAPALVRAAANYVRQEGADVIVTNQSHRGWAAACRRAGFLDGPSNFIFSRSPALTSLLKEQEIPDDQVYLNRGDGDGPIHL